MDPVRFIGNRSSGKQGHTIAEEAAATGAAVTLVTTTTLAVPAGVERRAAVATTTRCTRRCNSTRRVPTSWSWRGRGWLDFSTQVHVADEKLKKQDGVPAIELRPTVDILAELGAHKAEGQTLVGFAAETTDLTAHAAADSRRRHGGPARGRRRRCPGRRFRTRHQ